jgi:hypothetical protein
VFQVVAAARVVRQVFAKAAAVLVQDYRNVQRL